MNKKKKDNELKYVEDTRFEVTRVVGNIIGKDGKRYQKLAKISQVGDLKLGSIMKPKNTDVVHFRYSFPRGKRTNNLKWFN